MFEELQNLLNNSYAPYSNYRVAAIIVTKDNQLFKGVNIENASFGATICAERSAICSAISNGCKDFKELYVMVDSEKLATPCFLCRQVISELCPMDMKVTCFNKLGNSKTYLVSDLCIEPFGRGNLE